MDALVTARIAIPRSLVCRYASSMIEGILIPARPEAPLYIIVVVICLPGEMIEGERREKEYEKSAWRNSTPSRLYRAMRCG